MSSNDEIWTMKELAEYLKLSVRKVSDLLKSGAIRAAKIDRQWRIRREAALEYIRANEQSQRGK